MALNQAKTTAKGPFSNPGLGSVSGWGSMRCVRSGKKPRPSVLYFFGAAFILHAVVVLTSEGTLSWSPSWGLRNAPWPSFMATVYRKQRINTYKIWELCVYIGVFHRPVEFLGYVFVCTSLYSSRDSLRTKRNSIANSFPKFEPCLFSLSCVLTCFYFYFPTSQTQMSWRM